MASQIQLPLVPTHAAPVNPKSSLVGMTVSDAAIHSLHLRWHALLTSADAVSTSQRGAVCSPPQASSLGKCWTQPHGSCHCTNIYRGSTIITSHLPLLPVSSGDEDFLEITEYLIALEKIDVYNLGLVLGLNQHKVVAKMDSKTFLDDIITAWLRKEDQVIKRGEPSWRVLVSALKHRRVGQTGIATKIAMDKGLLL